MSCINRVACKINIFLKVEALCVLFLRFNTWFEKLLAHAHIGFKDVKI